MKNLLQGGLAGLFLVWKQSYFSLCVSQSEKVEIFMKMLIYDHIKKFNAPLFLREKRKKEIGQHSLFRN